MTVDVINRPEAADLDVQDVVATDELESCNHLLDDPAALNCFYEDKGYILLRGVFDAGTVARARDEMLAVAAQMGLVEPGDPTGRWTGKALPGSMEESTLYAGIAKRLIEDPANLAVMEQVLGEPACAVPIVQYRTYPPHSKLGTVHQDGFYSPGIQDYRPVWVSLTPCSREMGGLALAVGQNRRGYFHNVGKPNPFPIPRDAIPDDSWATTDYLPGDVLVVHPCTPHCGLANTSDRLRISFDSRVQSAARPSAIAATVTGFTANTVTVDADRVGTITLNVDADSYLRPINPGVRESFEGFADYMRAGMRLTVVRDGDRVVMLRKAAEG